MKQHSGSLRHRLLLATVMGLAAAFLLAGLLLNDLFRAHVRQQFQIGLTQQLDHVTAHFSVNAQGQPEIDSQVLSDPRWKRPYSGLYWQVDQIAADGKTRQALRRSRSLWDHSLQLSNDPLQDGAVHMHEAAGPQGTTLMVLERTVRLSEGIAPRWRLMVGSDLSDTAAAIERFGHLLALSLFALFVLLCLATWAQLSVGLRPLREMQSGLQQVQDGHTPRLEGRYPSEIQPLVDDFNRVLDHNRAVVERARTQAGNLAHALKTPLAVLGQAASRDTADHALAQLVQEQVSSARRHIDWHLARSRISATQHLPGQRTDMAGVLRGLIRVMERVHADRHLTLSLALPLPETGKEAEPSVCFAGEEQDLQEMVGNLLDNAFKWARSRVEVSLSKHADAKGQHLQLILQDDGPGIDETLLKAVMARGMRLDEAVPGSGLGLAIAQELAMLYGGQLVLGRSPMGGLMASLQLPRALD
jgi:signal transduction histidine kinase